MTQRAAARTGLIGFAILMTMLVPPAASAATWTAFGRRCSCEAPVRPTQDADVQRAQPGRGVRAAGRAQFRQPPQTRSEITLNGARVQSDRRLRRCRAGWPVRLGATNQLVLSCAESRARASR